MLELGQSTPTQWELEWKSSHISKVALAVRKALWIEVTDPFSASSMVSALAKTRSQTLSLLENNGIPDDSNVVELHRPEPWSWEIPIKEAA